MWVLWTQRFLSCGWYVDRLWCRAIEHVRALLSSVHQDVLRKTKAGMCQNRKKGMQIFYTGGKTPISHMAKTWSSWTNIRAVRLHLLWLPCQSEMFVHSDSPADTDTERQGGRNINKDPEIACQCAHSVLITLKAVSGTRYVLGPYSFFILFGIFPNHLTLCKNETGIVSLHHWWCHQQCDHYHCHHSKHSWGSTVCPKDCMCIYSL